MALIGQTSRSGNRSGNPWAILSVLACTLSMAVSCQVWQDSHGGDDSRHQMEKTEQFTFAGWAATLAFAQKGSFLAVGGCLDSDLDGDTSCAHGLLEMWNLKQPGQHSSFRFPRAVTALAVSPDGNKWVAGDAEGRLILSTTSSRVTRKPLHHKDRITALAFSPDGKWLASGSLDPAFPLGFMDLVTGGMIKIKVPFEPVSALAFSPDGKDLAVGTIKGQLAIWTFASQAMPIRVSSASGEAQAITGITFSPDGRLLAYGRRDGRTVIVDRSVGQELIKFNGGAAVSALAFSPDNHHLAVAQESGRVLVLEPHSSRPIWVKRHVLPVSDLAYSPDGSSLAVASQRHVYLYRVNGEPSSLLSRIPPQ